MHCMLYRCLHYLQFPIFILCRMLPFHFKIKHGTVYIWTFIQYTVYKRIQLKIWLCMNVFCIHTNNPYWQKNWTHLKRGQRSQDCIKIKKKKNMEGGRSNKNHYILTVPQETQRSLFSQKTVNIADPQSGSSFIWLLNTDFINPPWVQVGVQKTQAADLRSGRSCSSDRTMAC